MAVTATTNTGVVIPAGTSPDIKTENITKSMDKLALFTRFLPLRSDMPGHTHVIVLAIALICASTALPALAHTGDGHAGGFVSGFTHPILGWDHVAAMIAVGLWGAFLGSPAIWILPVVFPLVMALGAVAGIAGIPVPAIEMGIALSAVVLGVMIVFAIKPPIWICAVIVGTFAIFHGYAHGTELPSNVNALAYAVGFVISTGLLHMTGVAFGLLVRWPVGRAAVRGAGGLILFAGIAFLTGVA